MTKRLALTLCLLLGLAPSGPAAALEKRNFLHQETERAYYIHNDKPVENAPRPLVVALHGYSGKGEAVRGSHRLAEHLWAKLDEIAQREGFVTLYPVALHGQWNLFPGLKDTTLESGEPADDVGYIHGLVADMVAKGIADPNRIYLTGFSDGAILSYRLLCLDGPGVFAAAVPIAGSMHQPHYDSCAPDFVPPILVIAGTRDPILPYDGWLFSGGREVSIPETMELWRKLHGCDAQSWTLMADRVVEDSSRVRAVTWTGCATPDSVKLLRIEGGGHQAPSFTPGPARWTERFGPRNQDIESAEEIWRFLSVFAK
ncbi:MAG: PHB depolymerase family esterase [Pseudomonadota bacterium]